MKHFQFFLVFMFTLPFLKAQNGNICESKGLYGVWKMTEIHTPQGVRKVSGTYKIINPDNTYFTLQAPGNTIVIENGESKVISLKSIISGYGSLTITSDSTYIEHVKSNSSPGFAGNDVPIRYKMPDENTLISEYFAGNIWIPEVYERVLSIGAPSSNISRNKMIEKPNSVVF